MRGNLLVVARVGGSEILRPRVQRGGERSVGVKFPNSSPKTFFAFGLHRERAEIAAGGARRAQEPLLFFRVFYVCFNQCLCRGRMYFSRIFSLWSRDLQESDSAVGQGALSDFPGCGVAICNLLQ